MRFEVDGASIALVALAVAYLESDPEGNNDSENVEGRFYHPDSQPFSQVELEEQFPRAWERRVRVNRRFPTVKWVFSVQGISDYKLLAAAAFDGRTHYRLSSGSSSRESSESEFQVDLEMSLWHCGQLSRDSERAGATFVFAQTPSVHWVPIELAFLDSDTNRIQQAASGRSGEVMIVSARGQVSAIRSIQAKYYSTVRRLVFRLPSIPGLPEANQALGNLFDTRIPYARVSAKRLFQEGDETLGGRTR